MIDHGRTDTRQQFAPELGSPEPVRIHADGVTLQGELVIPVGAQGLVLFAHGSGSSRLSPRNRHVAHVLQRVGLATLLFDLLTASEEEDDVQTAALRFDVALLTRRVVGATDWARAQPALCTHRIGCFGASTGAAAALVAASERPDVVRAVVSRGGRPDLAGRALTRVRAPTRLIVGGEDPAVLDLNRAALATLRCERDLAIVEGATHLFEEPGALDEVARLASEWFTRHLPARDVSDVPRVRTLDQDPD